MGDIMPMPTAHCHRLKSCSVLTKHPQYLDISVIALVWQKTSPGCVLICLIASLTESAWHSAKVTSVG